MMAKDQLLTRRGFLRAGGMLAGTAAMAGVLAGCSNGGGSASGSASASASGSASASASASGSAAAADNKVILGYWGGTCEMPIYVGYEKGFFKDAGLDCEIMKITEDVAPLMANGDLDCFELTPDKFKPMEQGLECVIIDSLHYGCQQGVASASSGIKSYRDLEGKKVAAKIGSISQIVLAAQMKQAGLDPNKVEWLTYKNAQMQQALEAGEIDAMAAYDPWPDIILENVPGSVRYYSWTYDEELKNTLCCFVGMSTRRLNENPALGKMLSEGFKKSAEWIVANPEGACDLAINAGYVPINTDTGFTRDMMIQEVKDYRFVSGDKKAIDDSFKTIWEWVAAAGAMEDAPADVEKYITQDLYNKMVKLQF